MTQLGELTRIPLVPRVRRRVLVATAVAVVMATAVTVFTSPTAADTDYFDQCPTLVLYGSRGSGEPGPNDPPIPGQPDRHGLGLGIWELSVALAPPVPPGRSATWPTPAVDPVDAIPDVGPYVASVAAGVTSLRADLPAIAWRIAHWANLGSRPRYQIYWNNTLLLDQHMPPAW